jgi:hypothetical protein
LPLSPPIPRRLLSPNERLLTFGTRNDKLHVVVSVGEAGRRPDGLD